ncbi:hypothetical protein GWI33_019256 [Rhynchophorus ferrugineus]|uniref:Transposase n=1 Tax=Rhynchophorus ferrugineus TaxID=354439 RepID=A0A834HS25_RHYFE|nr:hypothetical protein GWI33_019256 [Rhynchophorus ferrugineus]
MSTEDGERNRRPKEVPKKIHKMILNDRKLKLNEIADTLKISTERVHHIIHEYLSMRRLCEKRVPHELIFNQKQRVDYSEQCLKIIKRNKPEILRGYVTMDEKWFHHFIPKSNPQSSQWTADDEPAPEKINMKIENILSCWLGFSYNVNKNLNAVV